MPHIWTIGEATDPFDLADETVVPFKKLVQYTPNEKKVIASAGCGALGTVTAVVKEHKITHWTRAYELWCSGGYPSDGTTGLQEAQDTANAIDAEVKKARDKSASIYLRWQNYNLTAPIVWSVLTGITVPIREELYGMDGEDGGPFWVIHFEVDLVLGEVALYG